MPAMHSTPHHHCGVVCIVEHMITETERSIMCSSKTENNQADPYCSPPTTTYSRIVSQFHSIREIQSVIHIFL